MSPDGSTVATTWALPRARADSATPWPSSTSRRGDLTDRCSTTSRASTTARASAPTASRSRSSREKRSTPHDPGDRRLCRLLAATTGLSATSPATGTTGPRARWSGPPTASALVLVADEDGRAPVFRLDVASGEFTRLTADPFTYSDVQVSPDGRHVYAMRTSYAEPFRPVRLDATTPDQESEPLRGPSATPDAARPARGGRDHGRRRHPRALVAGAARRRLRRQPGAAAAVDPRRPAGVVERLVVALEPVAGGGPGVRRAAARPGPVHRLRAGLHPPRLGQLGRGAVHRPDGGHRRGRRARRHRRDPHGGDGRLVRRLHGQLGRRAHRPVQGDRHPREPVGARPVRADHRRALVLGARDDPGDGSRPTARTCTSTRSSRRCW